MIIDNKYEIGEIVYLKTDIDQSKRIILSIEIFKAGELLYKVGYGTISSLHYEFEISKEIDVLLTTTN